MSDSLICSNNLGGGALSTAARPSWSLWTSRVVEKLKLNWKDTDH
ncbi:MAG: hypothetical protein ACLQVY_24650 [Limisphaerales bacterium]